MPKATVTVRELKNKDTGIDLSVTSYREIPGLVRSTFEYQIVVVSSLSCFKLPSHKESDVVQFTLFKKFPEFEELRAKLNEAFSGTALPPLLKKSIIVSEAVIKERRNNLDAFARFLSATPRIVTSSHVLTFLGVEAAKARRFASGESEGSTQQEEGQGESKEDPTPQEAMTSSNLFEEEEEEEEDFLATSTSAGAAVQEEDDFFSTSETQSSSKTDTRLFESQDLKRELTEEDEKDFAFLPDAIVTKREVVSLSTEDSETDLFHVDEDIDLDKLLTLDTSGTKQQKQPKPSSPSSQPEEEKPKTPSPSKPQPPQKPTVAAKPKPAPKPSSPAAAKPPIPAGKPEPPSPSADSSGSKSGAAIRPVPAPRKLKPLQTEKKAGADGSGPERSMTTTTTKAAAVVSDAVSPAKVELSSDDIMQYIAAADSQEQEADLDLFS